MKRLIYIGSQYLGHTPDDGETMKNQLMREAISPYFDKVIPIDLRKRPTRFVHLLKLGWYAAFYRNTTILLSASVWVAYKILIVLYLLHRKHNVYYWVVGGLFDKLLVSKQIKIKYYRGLEKIIVQGKLMEANVLKSGLSQVLTVPNSKKIDYFPKHIVTTNQVRRFVFLSRIIPEKGVEELLSVVSNINLKYKNIFELDFYGRLDKQYESRFLSLIDSYDNVSYKGLLDLTTSNGYDILSRYDMMVFPTFYHGEGFPGVIIDAYISGLPVIASDWRENPNVITHGSNGVIYPTHDISALETAMVSAINGDFDIATMSHNSRVEANKYDIRNIITKELLLKIGLINN